MADSKRYSSNGNYIRKRKILRKSKPKIIERESNIIYGNFNENNLNTNQNLSKPPTSNLRSLNDLQKQENTPDNDSINNTKNITKNSDNKAKTRLEKLGGWFGRHKKASIGGLSGILVGGTLVVFGGLLSGPMSVIHAAEFIGDIADTIHDVTNLSRTVKNLSKAANTTKRVSDVAKSNPRVSKASKVMVRSFEKSFSKVGMEFAKDSGGKIIGIAFQDGAVSARNLDKLKDAGNFADIVIGDGKTKLLFKEGTKLSENIKSINDGLKTAVKSRAGSLAMSIIEKNSVLASMTSRIGGVVNLLLDFHPIKSLTKTIKNGLKTVYNKMIGNFIKRKALSIAEKAGSTAAGKAAKAVAGKISKALKGAAEVGKGVFRGITTAIKVVPIVGTIVGFISSFIFELGLRRLTTTSFETNLNIAAGTAMNFQSTASQIKSGEFPSESADIDKSELSPDETTEDGSPLQEIGLFSEANLFQEYEYIDEEALPSDHPCHSKIEVLPEPPEKDRNDDPDGWEKFDKEYDEKFEIIRECLADTKYEDEVIGTANYDFWKGAMVKHEMGDANYQTHDSLLDGVVPPELISETYDKGLYEDIMNSIIAAAVIVSPDMFDNEDGTLDPESANPTQVGSIATAGAKTLSNSKMLAAGGYSHEAGSPGDKEIVASRKQHVQDEFNTKPMLAKIFDVEDYQSAVVTLARNSGWNTSDQSIGTQLKNVAKTFASLPNLIASSFNKMSYASVSNSSDFYGFGSVGYTQEQLTNLPSFDVAADGVVKFENEIEKGNLTKLGVKDISNDGRVTYQEDTNADNLDIRAKETNLSFGNNKHEVILCNNGDFVWTEDGNTCEHTEVKDEDGSLISGKKTYTTDQIVRAYLLDYPMIMSAAAEDYEGLCNNLEGVNKQDCDSEKTEASNYIGEAMNDIGVSTGSSSSDGSGSAGNSEFNADTIQDDFQKTGCKYGDYSVGSNGCTTISAWFVGEYTKLKYGRGNGGQVAKNLAAANNLSVTSKPVAPAIFSSTTYNSSSYCGGVKCGHTGLVIKVEGDTVHTLETWSSFGGQNPCSTLRKYKMSDYPIIEYVNLGDHLK